MNSRKRTKKQCLLVFLLAFLTVATYCLPPMFGMGMEAVYADPTGIAVPGGGALEFTAQDATTSGGYMEANGQTLQYDVNAAGAGKAYTVRLVFRDMPTGVQQKIHIELKSGLMFEDNATGAGEPSLLRALTSAGIQETTEQIDYWGNSSNAELGYYGAYALRSNDSYSTQKATINRITALDGVSNGDYQTFTWEFQVKGDADLPDEDITDAIKVTCTNASGMLTVKANAQCDMNLIRDHGSTRTGVAVNNGSTIIRDNNRLIQSGVYGNGVIGMWKSTYVCPAGVSMELAPGAADYFTLTKSENTYTLQSKALIRGGALGDYYEPVQFKLALTAEQYPDGYVEIPSTKQIFNRNNEVVLDGSYTRQLFVGKDDQDVYTMHKTMADYLKNGNTAYTSRNPLSTRTRTAQFLYLGNFTMGNAGLKDSDPKTVRMTFNAPTIKAKAVPIILPEGNVITSVTVETNKRTKTFTVEKSGTTSEQNDRFVDNDTLTTVELGLDADEYFKSVEYDAGVLPAMWSVSPGRNTIIAGEGDIAGDGETIIGTIEVFNTSDSTITTGAGTLCWKYGDDVTNGQYGHAQLVATSSTSQTISAGETQQKWYFRITSNTWEANSFQDYNVYICVPDDASINMETLKVTIHGKDVTDKVKVSPLHERTADSGEGSKNYYKFTFKDIPLMDRSLGLWIDEAGSLKGNENGCIIEYDIKTKLTTPGGTYLNRDNMFVERLDLPFGKYTATTDLNYVPGNPYGFEGITGTLFTLRDSNALTINGLTEIAVENSGKSGDMTDYIGYDVADESTVLPIGITSDDKVQLKTNITNLTGIDVGANGTTIWLPIPKRGENWGALIAGSKDKDGAATAASPYSIQLTDKVTGFDSSIYKVEYGIGVTPPAGDYSKNWDQGTGWITDPTPQQLKQVNCIKLTQIGTLPNKDAAGEPYSLDVVADVVADDDDVDEANAMLVLRAQVYRDLTVNGKVYADFKPAQPSAMKLSPGNGIVSFDTAGGTPATIDDLEMPIGDVIKSQSGFPADPTKTGHTFLGWKLPGTGTPNYLADDTTLDGASLKLTADWKANKFKVVYDGNGATAGSMSDVEITYGDGTTALACAYKNTGKKFTAWNTAANGMGTPIAVGADISKITDIPNHTVTLYAQWEDKTYSVKYEMNGGTPQAPRKNNVKWTDADFLSGVTEPTKDHCLFKGWYSDKDFTKPYTGQAFSEVAPDDSADSITLYAKWLPITYKVVDETTDDEVTPSKPVQDPQVGDSIQDSNGDSWTVTDVAAAPDPNTGIILVKVKRQPHDDDDFTSPGKPGKVNKNGTGTADEAALMVVVALLLASVLCLTFLLRRQKKQ